MNWIRQPRRDGFAERFIQDVAAAGNVAASHETGRQDRASLRAAHVTIPRRRTAPALRLLPRTVQLCTHCRRNPAGFWVSGHGDRTARRPWCLACCQGLDLGCCAVIPFDS